MNESHNRAQRLRRLQRYGRARTAGVALSTGRSVEQVVTEGLQTVKQSETTEGGRWVELPGTEDVIVGFTCPPRYTLDEFRAMLAPSGSR